MYNKPKKKKSDYRNYFCCKEIENMNNAGTSNPWVDLISQVYQPLTQKENYSSTHSYAYNPKCNERHADTSAHTHTHTRTHTHTHTHTLTHAHTHAHANIRGQYSVLNGIEFSLYTFLVPFKYGQGVQNGIFSHQFRFSVEEPVLLGFHDVAAV